MPNLGEYNRSSLDIPGLKTFAKRVARETSETQVEAITEPIFEEQTHTLIESYGPFGLRKRQTRQTRKVKLRDQVLVPEHWVLHSVHWIIERQYNYGTEIYRDDTYWALLGDGQLIHFTYYVERLSGNVIDSGLISKEVNAATIERLDFADSYSDHRNGETHSFGNREPGALERHARGAGLSLALKRLL